ncbi:MAG: hypothetical protein KGJ39_05780 [Acidobacteriota bacterium]|nr:hypothetical protein [Acidobacteriota bacterium]
MKKRSLAALALVATLGVSAGLSDVVATSAYAGGPAAQTFVLNGTVVGVNAPVHQFTVLRGTARYMVMTTTRTVFTLNAVRTTFAGMRMGQTVSVRGVFRARYRVATMVTLRANAPIPVSTVPATAPLTSALTNALNQERYALATYKNVVAKFGAVRPFTNIIASEAQHVATVTALMTAHAVPVPASTTTGAPAPATLTASCQLGVNLETSIIAMYQNGIALAKDYPDVVRAFSNLLDASQSGHLPAFLRCS